MLTYGQVKQWRPEPLDAAGEGLRTAISRLSAAGDEVGSTAVPGSWSGPASLVARGRQGVLVASMDARVERARTLMRGVLTAESSITALRRSIEGLEGEAGAKEFRIGADGSVTSTAEPPSFGSRWEAEEWSDARTRLAQGLADEVGRIVDRAVEIDAALLAAIPFRDDEADLRGTPHPGVTQRWAELTDAERRAILTQIAREELADLDLDPPPEVTFVDPDDPDADPDFHEDGLNGRWSSGRNEIWIHPDTLDDPRRIGTAAHEARHARQSDAIDDLDAGLWDRLRGHDPFEQHEDAGVSRRDAEEWERNFDDYISDGDPKPGGGTYDYDDYTSQPVEDDAFDAGSDYLDDLTPEELERLLEESR